MICCNISCGAGVPVPSKGTALVGEAQQPGNHAAPASWTPRRTRAFLAAEGSPRAPARSRAQSSREAPLGSSSDRNGYIDVEARVHPSEEEEENLLLELAERLRRLKGSASGRQFSRIMRSGRVKLTAPRVCRLLRVLTDAGSWREALAVVQWMASRESTSVGLDRRILTTLVAGLGYKRPAAVVQVVQLMLSGRETWPDMPAFRAVAVALGRAGRLKELLQLTAILRTGYQDPSQPDEARAEDNATRSAESATAVPVAQSADKDSGPEGDKEGREGGEGRGDGAGSSDGGEDEEAGEAGARQGLRQGGPPLPPWMEAQQKASRDAGQPLAPDVVVYNAILTAVAWHKEWQGVAWVFQQMEQDGVAPNEVSYGLALKALCKGGRAKEVWELMQEMESLGMQPSARAYKEIVELLGQQGRPAEAEALVARMEADGVPGSAAVLASLARVFCRCGRWQDAVGMLPRVCQAEGAEPPAVTATGLIRACEEAGRLEDACRLFRALVPQAPGPDPWAPPLPREGSPLALAQDSDQDGEASGSGGGQSRAAGTLIRDPPLPEAAGSPEDAGAPKETGPPGADSSPSASPSGSSLGSGQRQEEEVGGGRAALGPGKRGRKGGGRKGRREGQGEAADKPPPPVVVVPNIILCNVMLKIYGKTGRFADACWMMEQVRRGRVGGGRHAVGEERLSADAHTWDAFLGCCIQSRQWGAAEAAVGDRTRQGFPLRMERHAWALDAALNAGQESLAAALTRHMQHAISSGSARALPSHAEAYDGPGDPEECGAPPSVDADAGAATAGEEGFQQPDSTGSSRQGGEGGGGAGRRPAGGGGRPWRPPGGNPVVWHLDQVVAAGGRLDEFSWRYAIHSVGPALTAGAVREVLARVKAQEVLPGATRGGGGRAGSSAGMEDTGVLPERGESRGAGGPVESLSRNAMAGILTDLCRAVAHGGGRAEALAAVQLVEEMRQRGLSPPHGLLSSVLQRCLKFGLAREAALLKARAPELQVRPSATQRGDPSAPRGPFSRAAGSLRPSPFPLSSGAGKRETSRSEAVRDRAAARDPQEAGPSQQSPSMGRVAPPARSGWAKARAGLQREGVREWEGEAAGLMEWGSREQGEREGEGGEWGWGPLGEGGQEGKEMRTESGSDASAADSERAAGTWLGDDASQSSAGVPGAQEILTLWEEQAVSRGERGRKGAG